jgi:hypothetical protein
LAVEPHLKTPDELIDLADLRMLASDCCSLGELPSARTPSSMSASVGSIDAPGVSRSSNVREKTLDGK